MKLNLYITIFLILFQIGLVFGQNFAPIGAEWYYTEQYAHSGDISYLHISSVGDTIIKGKDCMILENNGGLVCAFHNEMDFVFYEDSIAYFYVPEIDTFQILYDLRAQKDSSWAVVFSIGMDVKLDTIQIFVDSVSIVSINSQNLKKLHVSYKSFNSGWEDLCYSGEIIERIGDTHYLFNLYTLSGMVCDGNYSAGLRCYTDSELGSYSTGIASSCTYVGIESQNSDFDFKIYPNPTSDQIEMITNIQSDYKITLFNLLGKPLFLDYKSGHTIIDLSNFENGIYFLQISCDDNVIGMRKIIKY